MSRILFIEQFYYPEGWGGARLALNTTMYLALTGKKVEVICGGDQYVPVQQERVPNPRRVGVAISKVPRILGGSIRQRKAAKQVLFYALCLPLLIFRRKPGVIISQTNPPLVVVLAALASIVHRCAFVIIAQDVYPDVIFASGMLRPGSVAGRVLGKAFAWAYGRADRIIALGGVMATRLAARGAHPGRIEVIPNWATGPEGYYGGDCRAIRNDWGLEGKRVILYTGNIGVAHEVETALLAMQRLNSSRGDVRLVFVGGGAGQGKAQRLCEQLGLKDVVQFRAPVKMRDLPAVLSLAEFALVTLRREFAGLVVPSKAVGYMARGVPTVFVGPASDIEELLTEAGGGLCCRNGDVATLTEHFRRLLENSSLRGELGRNAANYYRRTLRRTVALKKYLKVVEEVSASKMPSEA